MLLRQFAIVALLTATGLSSLAEGIRVLSAVGDVQFENASIKSGDIISKAGTIRVSEDKKSEVDLIYPEGHKIRLKSGAQLSIGGQKFGKTLTLLQGKSFMHFQKRPDVPEFQIKTKTAVAGVRGTKFLLEDRDGATYLCVCEGIVELIAGKETRPVAAGQDLWAWSGKPLGKPKTSPSMSKMTASEFESIDKSN